MELPWTDPWKTLAWRRSDAEHRRRRRAHIDTARLSHSAKRVLVILIEHWRWSNGGNFWESMSMLAGRIHRTKKETRQAVHELRNAGALRLSLAVDEDGMFHGSGYFLQPGWDI